MIFTINGWETMRSSADSAPEPPAKSRSNKIRREDGWDEAPKAPKRKKQPRIEVHERDEDAFVGSADFDDDSDEKPWDDE